jgi:S-adenosylmethionine/arginine decarboxylase-like enzyme
MSIKHWGQHISIDAKGGNNKIREENSIRAFFDKLVEAIDMEFWNDERNKLCVHFGKDDKQGFTYSALITTSNICCHFCDEGNFYLDIFSCKPIDATLVLNMVQTYFEPNKMKQKFFLRGDFD